MQSAAKIQETDPHDLFVIEPDVVLASRSDPAKVARAPASPAPAVIPAADRQPLPDSDFAVDPPTPPVASMPSVAVMPMAAPTPLAVPPPVAAAAPVVDVTAHASEIEDILKSRKEPSSLGRWFRRAAVVFTLALCSAFAAAVWKHHSETARQMAADWMPQKFLTLVPGFEGKPTMEPASAATQTAAVEPAAAPQAAVAAPNETAAAPEAASAVDSQQVQAMARDIGAMGQQIEELKASIAQLKTGQEQMTRELATSRAAARAAEARATEAGAQRPRIAANPVASAQPGVASAQPGQPASAAVTPPVRRPRPVQPVQAAASPQPHPVAPPVPLQSAPVHSAPLPAQATAQPADDGNPVVRPLAPMR